MKITIIGTGYVGLVSGICFSKIGHKVTCVDNNKTKIDQLKNGQIPIFEPGLKEILAKSTKLNLINFTSNLNEALQDSQAVFIAVGTPQDEDGSADLSYVFNVAKEIAQNSDSYKLIITKSTVPAGTGHKIKEIVNKTNPNLDFDIASNPEFLREGEAINDFLYPDRIVIGVENDKSASILQEIYQYFANEKIITCDVITAELIKYASNSFLATKISFINEMANLCEIIGGDIKKLSHAMGLDSRIGNKFLNPGPGFGGSCFPKDILAIANTAKNNDVDLSLINSVIKSNDQRYHYMVKKITKSLDGNVENKKIALLGLAFKANTDDIRYSPAIIIAKELARNGALITATDPQAITNSKQELKKFANITFTNDIYESIKDCQTIVIATEWPEFANLNFDKIKKITNCRKIIDLRNLLDKKSCQNAGFEYSHIGKKS